MKDDKLEIEDVRRLSMLYPASKEIRAFECVLNQSEDLLTSLKNDGWKIYCKIEWMGKVTSFSGYNLYPVVTVGGFDYSTSSLKNLGYFDIQGVRNGHGNNLIYLRGYIHR